jgi:2-succinyl-5-enolpyruvyl-6-hydroxy-3-cyclohexene-1-carboxylate synthase
MTLTIGQIAFETLETALSVGVQEFCICPGARNSLFIQILKERSDVSSLYFYDERSAGFFALGKSRAMDRPVAVITTSGTGPAHLLPAAMEAYYTGVPLLLITADRPRRFRGCNSPQGCEQVGLFGIYTPFSLDLDEGESCDLSGWDRQAPAHLNICLEDPIRSPPVDFSIKTSEKTQFRNNPAISTNKACETTSSLALDNFLNEVKNPFILVGGLKASAKEAVAQFLIKLNAPIFLEGTSGIREDPRLQHLRITRTERLLQEAQQADYPLDGILRIGVQPSLRLWRDLEGLQGRLKVLSIHEVPFSGLTWGAIACTNLQPFFSEYRVHKDFKSQNVHRWISNDQCYQQKLQDLFKEEPHAEPTLFHKLSQAIPAESQIFLGNSLPIREWDLAATYKNRNLQIHASRGLNGIDGQISTFLGISSRSKSNWGIFGDLTTLHDMSGLWILPQLEATSCQIVVVNNGGGKIFERMFTDKELQNQHELTFQPLAQLWNLPYQCWKDIPDHLQFAKSTLIELIPDNLASERFWRTLHGSQK